jgi:hypothetical protein
MLQVFPTTVTPFLPHLLVQSFGERLSQAIADGLRHDRVAVVVLGPELRTHDSLSASAQVG